MSETADAKLQAALEITRRLRSAGHCCDQSLSIAPSNAVELEAPMRMFCRLLQYNSLATARRFSFSDISGSKESFAVSVTNRIVFPYDPESLGDFEPILETSGLIKNRINCSNDGILSKSGL